MWQFGACLDDNEPLYIVGWAFSRTAEVSASCRLVEHEGILLRIMEQRTNSSTALLEASWRLRLVRRDVARSRIPACTTVDPFESHHWKMGGIAFQWENASALESSG